MRRLPQNPGLHTLPAGVPLPCGAAALGLLTGMPPARCVRILEDRHGYSPLASVVIPPTLDALESLGWQYEERAHPDLPFHDWAAGADPGLHLVSLPDHVIAAHVHSTPPCPTTTPACTLFRRAGVRPTTAGSSATSPPTASPTHSAAIAQRS